MWRQGARFADLGVDLAWGCAWRGERGCVGGGKGDKRGTWRGERSGGWGDEGVDVREGVAEAGVVDYVVRELAVRDVVSGVGGVGVD